MNKYDQSTNAFLSTFHKPITNTMEIKMNEALKKSPAIITQEEWDELMMMVRHIHKDAVFSKQPRAPKQPKEKRISIAKHLRRVLKENGEPLNIYQIHQKLTQAGVEITYEKVGAALAAMPNGIKRVAPSTYTWVGDQYA